MTDDWFARHRVMLDLAAGALASRDGFAPYGRGPEDYPDGVDAQGRQAFEACCNAHFHIDQPSVAERVGDEVSPYRGRLNILYPGVNVDQMLAAAVRVGAAWSRVELKARTAVCLEALDRLRLRVFELAHAVMHTTGAPFDIALRIGGLEALARSLEAVTIAHQEQESLPVRGSARVSDTTTPVFQPQGRGVALVVGCANMPTWTGLPALFADVATGNAVVVKPHPRAVLPWAIAVAVLRETLSDAGFDGDLVSLAAEGNATRLAALLACREEIRLIDYTGGAGFGQWLAEHAQHARQWRFAAATNVILVDSLADPDAFFAEVARSAGVFAGRLCTSPRVVLIPRTGVRVNSEVLDPDAFIARLALQFERFPVGDVAETLGATLPGEFDALLSGAAECGEVVVGARVLGSEILPGGAAITPALVRVDAACAQVFRREWFGPLLAVIETEDVSAAVSWAQAAAFSEGMLRVWMWSVDAGIRSSVVEALTATGLEYCDGARECPDVPAAFRDLHGSGMNPAANASLGAADFVVGRFRHVRLSDNE